MKFVLLGDTHFRASVPSSRVDDFRQVQQEKFKAVIEYANSIKSPILCTGDLFDRPDAPYSLIVTLIRLLDECKNGFYVVPGNHDLYGSSLSTLFQSALGVLVEEGDVRLLSEYPVFFEDGAKQVAVFGSSYMHPVKPEPLPGRLNIQVLHDMVLQEELWREQEDFIYAKDVLSSSDWDVILCGHYHYNFVERLGRRVVVNPGAMVRVKASKGDMALVPGFYVLDTADLSLERIAFITQPSSEVFCKDVVLEKSKVVLEFVESLREEMNDCTSLSDVMRKVLEDPAIDSNVVELVKEVIAEAEASARQSMIV